MIARIINFYMPFSLNFLALIDLSDRKHCHARMQSLENEIHMHVQCHVCYCHVIANNNRYLDFLQYAEYSQPKH